jgi:hypothetical protein
MGESCGELIINPEELARIPLTGLIDVDPARCYKHPVDCNRISI